MQRTSVLEKIVAVKIVLVSAGYYMLFQTVVVVAVVRYI